MMREWSCDSPRTCPSSNCSRPSTSAPARRESQYAAALPNPPSPKTMYSYSSFVAISAADMTWLDAQRPLAEQLDVAVALRTRQPRESIADGERMLHAVGAGRGARRPI